MKIILAATAVAATVLGSTAASAQVFTPATPRVGSPVAGPEYGPPAPLSTQNTPVIVPRDGPLPTTLSLQQALVEAEARAPTILAARARVEAAQARIRQAGYRFNPELSVEVANFLGTGELSGLRQTEATVSLNQRLDVSGRRRSRVAVAQAEVAAEQLRLAIARADLAQAVRQQFARAVTTRDRLRIAEEIGRAHV